MHNQWEISGEELTTNNMGIRKPTKGHHIQSVDCRFVPLAPTLCRSESVLSVQTGITNQYITLTIILLGSSIAASFLCVQTQYSILRLLPIQDPYLELQI